MSLFHGYSITEPTSEAQYLKREFGIEWITSSATNLIKKVNENASNGIRTLLIVDTNIYWVEILRALPDDSAVLMQISDETLSPELLCLPSLPSVSKIYRNYSVSDIPFLQFLFDAFFTIFFALQTRVNLNICIASIKYGYRMRQRAAVLKASGSVFEFPLGYTNKFANSYSRNMNLSHITSLFSHAVNLKNIEKNNNQVVFKGGPGGVPRQIAVAQTKKLRNVQIETSTSGWNGTEGLGNSVEDYIESLINCKFALCPPGTVSNESFRFFETLICRSLPITSNSTITQGTITNLHGLKDFGPSWRQKVIANILKYKNMSLYDKAILIALDSIIRDIENIKEDLIKMRIMTLSP